MSLRHRDRGFSFHQVDHEKASGVLSHVLKERNVLLGGCSFGVGLKKAAHYYVHKQQQQLYLSKETSRPDHYLDLNGALDLEPECQEPTPMEDSFFVLDLGVVVSQVYQWRRFFPRIEPFYAVKCNPDPVIIQTLATLGCNFDCASRQEIKLVQELTQGFAGRTPEIIYANPCKSRAHLQEAVCRGVRLVTFDNLDEVHKCAAVSRRLQMVLRIITDDRGSQCRFSSKFGAPRHMWRPLLAAAKQNGLTVVGVSFHVGSGCRDAKKYELALNDAEELFVMAKREFGFDMNLLDIGGGFPGETHSIWNPAVELDEDDNDPVEGTDVSENDDGTDRFMFFKEIAQAVAPVIDRLFPPSSGVRIIAEPGRFFVAAAATLCCSVVAVRNNTVLSSGAVRIGNDKSVRCLAAVDDTTAAKALDSLTREEESDLVGNRGKDSTSLAANGNIFSTIQSELRDYSKRFATQELSQQEFDVYNDPLDLYHEGYPSAIDVLGPPEEDQLLKQHHTAEGMTAPLVAASSNPVGTPSESSELLSLAAAGEAAVSGVLFQAVADSTPMQDDYVYYINDGVYGSFNNLMFDHARVRPRVLSLQEMQGTVSIENGFHKLSIAEDNTTPTTRDQKKRSLYSSTVFGPTCDSIDVIARSVLLPRLQVGDWMYFANLGAYTSAAASSFNGFTPSERFYVCSVQPEYFEEMIKGPSGSYPIERFDTEQSQPGEEHPTDVSLVAQ